MSDYNFRGDLPQNVLDAIDLAWSFGQIDGSHHRLWVINQMLLALLGEDKYARFVAEYEDDGEYKWDTGCAP